MQQSLGTSRAILGDGILEISVLEGNNLIGLFKFWYILSRESKIKRVYSSSDIFCVPWADRNPWRRVQREPGSPDTTHNTPVSPQTSVSRWIPSSTRALQTTGGDSLRLRHRQILIKSFLHIYNTFVRERDLELSVEASPGLHSNDPQKTGSFCTPG